MFFAFLALIAFAVLWKRMRDVSAHQAELLRAQDALRAAVERLERRVADIDGGVTAPPATLTPSPAVPAPITPRIVAAPPPARPIPEASAAHGQHGPRAVSSPAPPSDDASGFGAAVAASNWLIEFFTSGNVVAKVGMVVVFFGVAFLLRYAAERGLLPIEYRLMSSAAGAVALLAVGWRLRHSRPDYAVVLQGGAVGVLYLTIFAAFRLYALLPASLTFGLLVLVVAASALLAVTQRSMPLAVLGTGGGFLAPILASTGSGSHVALFSYYAVLNGGVVAIAWFRAWRFLNWLAFVFTFGVGFVWGQEFYEPALFSTTEPFLVLFFLLFLAVAVIFAHRQPPQLRGYIDGSLVFGTPAIAFGMQSVLVRDIPFARAYSAVALSALYLALVRTLWRRDAALRPLAEAFLALAIVFLILAVPLAFTGHATAAAWALEGAGLVWIGVRQHRRLARGVGAALLLGAGVAFAAMASPFSGLPVLNSRFLGAVAIAAGSLVAGRVVSQAGATLSRAERPVEWVLLIWGLLWWLGAVLLEVADHTPEGFGVAAVLLAIALSGCLAGLLARRWAWRAMMLATMAFGPLSWAPLVALFIIESSDGPLPNLRWLAWSIVVAANYLLLFWFERVWPANIVKVWHAATAWLAMFLVTWMLAVAVQRLLPEASAWSEATWCIVPVLFVVVLLRDDRWLAWPLQRFAWLYRVAIPALPVTLIFCWVMWACTQPGGAAPLPYVPLLNPLELAQCLALAAAYAWSTRVLPDTARGEQARGAARPVLALFAFLILNAVIARMVHFYLDVPFDLDSLLESSVFQTGISILWGVLAGVLMAISRRRLDRPVWMSGAGLLALLILKLFLVDLGQVSGIARIVSFLATGALILLIGYVAPAPPRAARTPTETEPNT